LAERIQSLRQTPKINDAEKSIVPKKSIDKNHHPLPADWPGQRGRNCGESREEKLGTKVKQMNKVAPMQRCDSPPIGEK